ncbi:MAG: hypothetical protein ACRCW3_03880, partial [Metamycoplasmataceae bacterium]
TNVVITNKTTPPNDITLERLEDSTYRHSVEFLNKLFDLGTVDQNTINININVTFENISDSQYKVILTSKSIDFKINNENMHESNPFNVATNLIISQKNPITESINSFETTGDNLQSVATLQKVFNFSFDQATITAGLTAVFTENSTNDFITITAKDGYIFNNGHRSIISASFNQIQGIAGTPKATLDPGTQMVPSDFNNPTSLKSLNTIRKLFNGITTQAMIDNNMTVRLNNLPNNQYTITLIANDGKTFLDGEEITSIVFQTNATTTLNISRRTTLLDTPTQSQLENDLHTFEVLNYLFNGITVPILDNITSELSTSGGNTIVILKPKSGYAFPQGAVQVVSIGFTPRP